MIDSSLQTKTTLQELQSVLWREAGDDSRNLNCPQRRFRLSVSRVPGGCHDSSLLTHTCCLSLFALQEVGDEPDMVLGTDSVQSGQTFSQWFQVLGVRDVNRLVIESAGTLPEPGQSLSHQVPGACTVEARSLACVNIQYSCPLLLLVLSWCNCGRNMKERNSVFPSNCIFTQTLDSSVCSTDIQLNCYLH